MIPPQRDDRDYTPPEELRPEPRYTRDEILAPLRELVTRLEDRGSAVFQSGEFVERWEVRVVMDTHDNPALLLTDVRRLLGARNVTIPERYTLEEAARVLARQECDQDGHDLESLRYSTAAGVQIRYSLSCLRCGARFQETDT